MDEGLPDAQLFVVHVEDNHFVDIIHFLTMAMAPKGYTSQKKKELVVHVEKILVIVGHLYNMVADEILQRYVPNFERDNILAKAYGGAVGEHYARKVTVQKILHAILWWPMLYKYSKVYCKACDACQRNGKHREGVNFQYNLKYFCNHLKNGQLTLLVQFSPSGRKLVHVISSLRRNI